MSKGLIFRFGQWLLGVTILCLFVCSRPAAASPLGFVTYDLSFITSCSQCPNLPVMGTVMFDPSTSSIGPWSFSVEGETIMDSTDPNAAASENIYGNFSFVDGQLVDGNYDFYSIYLESLSNPSGTLYDDFTPLLSCVSGCVLRTTPTPEPSSLLLLGTGLLGLGFAVRRFALS